MSAASAFPEPPSLIANTKLVGVAGWAWANAVAQAARAGASTRSSRQARLRRRAKLILSPFCGRQAGPDAKQHGPLQMGFLRAARLPWRGRFRPVALRPGL